MSLVYIWLFLCLSAIFTILLEQTLHVGPPGSIDSLAAVPAPTSDDLTAAADGDSADKTAAAGLDAAGEVSHTVAATAAAAVAAVLFVEPEKRKCKVRGRHG